MTPQEFYKEVGGNYEEVLERLMDDDFIIMFTKKFLEDTSFDDLTNALEAKDAEVAFRAAHTLTGVCQNLGLGRLYESSSVLTDVLRGYSLDGYEPLYEKVASDYKETIKAVEQLG